MREHRKSKEPALRSLHRRLISTCLEKQREPNWLLAFLPLTDEEAKKTGPDEIRSCSSGAVVK